MANLNSRYIETIGALLAMTMLGWLSFAKHSSVPDPLPDEETPSNNERVFSSGRHEIRATEWHQNRQNLRRGPIVPYAHHRLKIGTVVREKQIKVMEHVSEAIYMAQSLGTPGKPRKMHIDGLKPYARRVAERLEPPKLAEMELRYEAQWQILEDPPRNNSEVTYPQYELA